MNGRTAGGSVHVQPAVVYYVTGTEYVCVGIYYEGSGPCVDWWIDLLAGKLWRDQEEETIPEGASAVRVRDPGIRIVCMYAAGCAYDDRDQPQPEDDPDPWIHHGTTANSCSGVDERVISQDHIRSKMCGDIGGDTTAYTATEYSLSLWCSRINGDLEGLVHVRTSSPRNLTLSGCSMGHIALCYPQYTHMGFGR